MLTWLNISSNQLTAIPESIGQLASQSIIYQRQSTHCNPRIHRTTDCAQRLDISSNPLTAIPETLTNLTSLEEVHIDRVLENDAAVKEWGRKDPG